jgi:Fic family protein
MDINRLTPASPGRMARTADGHPAFVPDPLPPIIEMSSGLATLLAEAANAVGLLAGTGRNIQNPLLLIAPYLRREAVLSSRIEGTVSTLADLYEDEATGHSQRADVIEVRNYLEAHEYGLGRLATLPLSLRLLRELHGKLMQGVRGQERHPGEFRTYQNYIASHAGAPIEDAIYVPPPIPEMTEALDNLERFLHTDGLSPLLVAAIAHYQFEAIHPFGDGNGRVGRLLISIVLHERGLLPQPLLYLSAYFERTVAEYYDRLMRVTTHGDWTGWLTYFLTGISTQAHEAVEDAERVLNLQAAYHDQLTNARARAAAHSLVDELFINPYISASAAARVLLVSDPTARAAINDLVQQGILGEVTGRKWGKLFLAPEILRVARGSTDLEPGVEATIAQSR